MRFAISLCVTALALFLTGCASGPRAIDSHVQSVATPASTGLLHPGLRYRFEQLPLDVGQSGAAQVQALAQQALTRVGLVHDEATARVSVQATAYVNSYWIDDWDGPWGYDGPGRARMAFYLGAYGRHGGLVWGSPLWWDWDAPTPVYVHEASLILRDLKSGQVLYETRARHDGTFGKTDLVLTALFAAALQDFPHPPPGWRSVTVPLGAPAQAAPVQMQAVPVQTSPSPVR